VQFGVEDDLFLWMGAEFMEMHRRRMVEIMKQRRDVKVQAILREGDRNMLVPDYIDYRWIGEEVFSAVPFYVYGECLAMMTFQTIPPPTILLCKFPAIAASYRKQFGFFWKMSRNPDGVERAVVKRKSGSSGRENRD
jgi:hypothetical protein